MAEPVIRSAYSKRLRVAFTCEGKSMTQQNFAKECDINNIMAKYEKSGVIEHVRQYGGYYGTMPASTDLQANLEAVKLAQELFMSLPAGIRKDFDNDPLEYLKWAEDPANADAFTELLGSNVAERGEVTPPPLNTPQEVPPETSGPTAAPEPPAS